MQHASRCWSCVLPMCNAMTCALSLHSISKGHYKCQVNIIIIILCCLPVGRRLMQMSRVNSLDSRRVTLVSSPTHSMIRHTWSTISPAVLAMRRTFSTVLAVKEFK